MAPAPSEMPADNPILPDHGQLAGEKTIIDKLLVLLGGSPNSIPVKIGAVKIRSATHSNRAVRSIPGAAGEPESRAR